MKGAEILAQRIVRLIVAEEEFDPESLAYFRLMMELRERRRDRFSFWWRLLVYSGRWRMVGGAVAGAAVSAVSRGAGFPVGREAGEGLGVNVGASVSARATSSLTSPSVCGADTPVRRL